MRTFVLAPQCEAALKVLEAWKATGNLGAFPAVSPPAEPENAAFFEACHQAWVEIGTYIQVARDRIAADAAAIALTLPGAPGGSAP